MSVGVAWFPDYGRIVAGIFSYAEGDQIKASGKCIGQKDDSMSTNTIRIILRRIS